MNQVIDFSTLTWVKKELDETLKEARQRLEAHVENPQDDAQLEGLCAHLHQVYGTLQMVELYGASLLAEEMEQVARAMSTGSVGQHDDACEVLMRAILQLPDYLDRLISGHRDIPLVLLPLLNDLRAVRGQNLLSENAMFTPDLMAPLPEHVLAAERDPELQSKAREQRHRFQRGLLGWFRNQNTEASLQTLRETLEALQALGGDPSVVRLWWVACGLLDALITNSLDGSVALKRVLGQLDREIKRLIDEGEQALIDEVREDLFKNILFYCAQPPATASARVAEIQATYRLDELLPDEEEMSAARESLAGRNSDLFATVAVAVKDELARLKDSLDIILRNGCATGTELQPLGEALYRLADTLGMLGLGAARKAVAEKAEALQKNVDAGAAPADTVLMDVASTLLLVESSVDNMGGGRAVDNDDKQADEQLAENEYHQVMEIVVQEAIADLVRAKEAISAYIESAHDVSLIAEVPQWFNQVKGGMLLLGEARPAALVNAIATYIKAELIEAEKQATPEELESLADAVCGLEYFLESRREQRIYGASAMAVAEHGVERLGYPAEQTTAVEDAAPEPSAVTEDATAPPPAVPADTTAPPVEDNDGEPGNDDQPLRAVSTPLEPSAESGQLSAPPEASAESGQISTPPEASPESGQISALPGASAESGQLSAPPEASPESEQISAPLEVSSDAERMKEDEKAAHNAENDDTALAIIGADIDEEILEIFIEEAEEELASINEQLPVWLSNADDSEALSTMRRSWHTLKGSGRLVGAMRIGEFAWAFENMLNRVMDGIVPVTPVLKDLLQAAAVALPELVAQVKEGVSTQQPIERLMRHAEALSQGEDIVATDIDLASTQPLDAESVDEADAEVVQMPQPMVDAPADDQDPQALQEAEEEISQQQQGETQDLESVGSYTVMDPLLYDIFNTESRAHLEVIRQYLSRATAGEVEIDEPLLRALHTLHGSAHMADADDIAGLAGELEKLLKIMMTNAAPIDSGVCGLLQDSVMVIESMLSSLPQEKTVPAEYAGLLCRVADQLHALPTQKGPHSSTVSPPQASDEFAVEDLPEDGSDEIAEEVDFTQTGAAAGAHEFAGAEPLSAAGPDVEEIGGYGDDSESGSRAEDPYSEHDEELLEVFLEEAAENLEAADAALGQWRVSSQDGHALAELQRALHTLKGGARMADLPAIADVAHAVESLLIGIDENRAVNAESSMDGVQQAQDCLAIMLERVRAHLPLEPADELVASLQAQREWVATASAGEDIEPLGEASLLGQSGATEQAGSNPYAEVDQELLEVFVEEAVDITGHCEQTLQSWKQAPGDQELMTALQRELHTLKGGARMADITEIGDLAHAVESLMVKVTEGERACSDSLFVVLERAQDRLADMVEKVGNRVALDAAVDVITDLEKLRDGVDIEPATEQGPLQQTASEAVTSGVAAVAGKERRERRSRSRSSQELIRVKAELLDNMVNYAGEVSIYRSRLEQQVGAYSFNLVEMEQTVARVREQLRKLEIETEAQVLYRYEREGEMLDDATRGEDFDPLEMDRYSHMQQLSRSLMESVSDLSSIQNMLENITRESETLLLQQSRVNTELQEGLMRTRMVPFLGLAARMRRIVRQTAQELDKKAELELSGAEGEMDRTVVDRIVAPLEHMLRNAISHGIETPARRVAEGKPQAGTIRITLERESSDVVLRISDDGAGINLEAIRGKAIQRGLMDADSELSDNEVLQFILETGFSTAEKVTQVAGRGVGMDVVNSEVKQLGGSLHIDSTLGKGTTFTVRLPFTLALNQALLVEVGEDTYAIPLSSIEGIVRMRREDLKRYYADPEARFEYGQYAYEVRHLGSVLATGAPHLDSGPKRLPVLLARFGEHCVAFHVENLLGSREIVVKSVGPQISTVPGVSGATILGDGRVVMILEVSALLRGGTTSLTDQVHALASRPAARRRGLTVMVVDDSITVRKVTTRILERNDMRVIAAKDGVDAVSKLQENIPDIMLLDIEMPRMDGFELATHVRNEARLRDIPIIMITSRTGDKHRQRAMQIGVNRYLGKPFQESDLLENIQALLEDTGRDG